MFELGDGGVALPDHRVDAGQIPGAVIPLVSLRADRQECYPLFALLDRLVLATHTGIRDTQRAMHPGIVGPLPDSLVEEALRRIVVGSLQITALHQPIDLCVQ